MPEVRARAASLPAAGTASRWHRDRLPSQPSFARRSSGRLSGLIAISRFHYHRGRLSYWPRADRGRCCRGSGSAGHSGDPARPCPGPRSGHSGEQPGCGGHGAAGVCGFGPRLRPDPGHSGGGPARPPRSARPLRSDLDCDAHRRCSICVCACLCVCVRVMVSVFLSSRGVRAVRSWCVSASQQRPRGRDTAWPGWLHLCPCLLLLRQVRCTRWRGGGGGPGLRSRGAHLQDRVCHQHAPLLHVPHHMGCAPHCLRPAGRPRPL